MARWLKITLTVVVLAVIAIAALGGTAGYYFFRHLERGQATEADVVKRADAVRLRFPDRAPLIEIVNPQAADLRINRTAHPQGLRATTVFILSWNAEDGERMESNLPLWLMRFSSINVLSQIGVAPDRFSLTVADVERYGPGIVADYRRKGEKLVLMWVE